MTDVRYVDLEIRLPDATIPKSVGYGIDSRRIAVDFYGLKITRQGANTHE